MKKVVFVFFFVIFAMMILANPLVNTDNEEFKKYFGFYPNQLFVVKGYNAKNDKIDFYLITGKGILDQYFLLIRNPELELPFKIDCKLVKSFFKSLIDGKMIFCEREKESVFPFGKVEKDSDLDKEYKEKGINNLIKKYFDTSSKNLLKEKNDSLTVKKKKYLVYLLVEEGYIVVFSDSNWRLFIKGKIKE